MAKARHLGLNLSAYGETFLFTIQDGLIILCVFIFDKQISIVEEISFYGGFAIYATLLLGDHDLPENFWVAVSGSIIYLALMKYGFQMHKSWREGSTGQVSFGTIVLHYIVHASRTISVLL